MTDRLEIRRLTYSDLPQVVAIERRAFPTAWSLAMFVLELSKPSGVCLAALREGTRLPRYDAGPGRVLTPAEVLDLDRRRAGAARARGRW